MIIRIAKRTPGWTVIQNTTLQDERLSYKATGLLAYLLSRPDDWRVNREDLANRKTDGVAAIRSALNELEACGYLVRSRKRLSNGTFETTLIVHECPAADAKTVRPEAGNRTADSPTADDQPPLLSTQTDNPDLKGSGPTADSGGRGVEPQGARSVERADPDPAREIVDFAWAKRKEMGKPLPTVRSGSPYMALVQVTKKLLEAGRDPVLIAMTLFDSNGPWTNDALLVAMDKVQRGKATDPALAEMMRKKAIDDEIRRQDEAWAADDEGDD